MPYLLSKLFNMKLELYPLFINGRKNIKFIRHLEYLSTIYNKNITHNDSFINFMVLIQFNIQKQQKEDIESQETINYLNNKMPTCLKKMCYNYINLIKDGKHFFTCNFNFYPTYLYPTYPTFTRFRHTLHQ